VRVRVNSRRHRAGLDDGAAAGRPHRAASHAHGDRCAQPRNARSPPAGPPV